MRKKSKVAYYPNKGPVWLTVRSLQVVSSMATFEEEDKEPQLETSIQGVAQFSRNLGIGVIGDTGTYTKEVGFSISSQNYRDIVEHRKQLIEKHRVDDDINLFCNDKLGTSVYITYMYSEYSEVGKLWDESWSVILEVPDNLMKQLLGAIQFDRIDAMEVGLQLLNVYTDKDPDDLSYSYDRDQSMLFLKPLDDERSVKQAFGYVHSLGMGSRKRATHIFEEELLQQGRQAKGMSDHLDSDARLDEAQIASILLTKLNAIQTLLKTIVVILLLCALLWVAV